MVRRSLNRMVSLRLIIRRKPLTLIAAAVFLFFLLRFMRGGDINWDVVDTEFDEDSVGEESMGRVHRDPELKADKWIVVTTIQQPTQALQKMVQLRGWKLLIVADRKTPRNYILPGAIVLDLASQKALGYEVYEYLPYDSYTRKIIGYLYAIEHGAKYIYDTDDDHHIDGDLSQFKLSTSSAQMLLLKTSRTAVNYFRHFGQSSMWPRGYPLESVGDVSSRDYTLCQLHVPAIQQSLVDGDPDVDAMFRLTRKHSTGKLDIQFDKAAPPMVLPKGTFSPTNSQNTLYTLKALWALVLPISVSDRSTDIYRSYWAQRLLWEIGENTGYFPATGSHQRNPHSYLMDAMEETELYRHMGQYINYLGQWACEKAIFFHCVSKLSHDLVAEGLWEKRDAYLVDAWMSDLATVGYAPPIMRTGSGCTSLRTGIDVVFYPDEQNTTLPHSAELHLPRDAVNHAAVESMLVETCSSSHPHHWHMTTQAATKYPSLLLVVSIQSDPQSVIPLLTTIYQPSFPHIVFCGPKMPDNSLLHKWRVTYITPPSKVVNGVSCVLAASLLRYHVDGHVHVSSRMLLNAGDSFASRKSNMVWTTGELDAYKPEVIAQCKNKEMNCIPMTKDKLGQLNRQANDMDSSKKFRSQLKDCFAKLASDPSFSAQRELYWITEAMFHIPSHSMSTFQELGGYFMKDSSKYEYSFLTLLLMECTELSVEYLTYGAFNDEKLDDSKIDFYFPYQFQKVPSKSEPVHEHYCESFKLYEED